MGIYIPNGEAGSVNELAKQAWNNPTKLAMELHGKPKTCLNVISVLEEYAGEKIALSFAKRIISLNHE